MTRRGPLSIAVALAALAALAGVVAARQAGASAILRTVAVGPSPSAVVVGARAGHAFVLGGDDTVSMLDARTGQVLRTIHVGKVSMALALDARAGRVYVVNSYMMSSGGRGTVTTLDAASGRVIRTVPAGNAPYAVAADEQAGHAFVLSASITGSVIMLDATSGRVLKAIDAGANGGPMLGAQVLAVDARDGRGFAIVSSDPTVGPQVSMFDSRRGVPLGIVNAGVRPFAVVPDAQNGRAFVLGSGGIAVIDTRSGHVAQVHTPYTSSVAIDARRGRVFSGDSKGIHVLDARTGRIVRTIALGRLAVSTAVDGRDGRIVALSPGPMDTSGSADGSCCYLGDGSVSVVDAQSGSTRMVAVGLNPIAAAIDERTGRLFVVNGVGMVRDADRWAWVPTWLRGKLPFLPPPGPRPRAVPGSVTVVDLSRL